MTARAIAIAAVLGAVAASAAGAPGRGRIARVEFHGDGAPPTRGPSDAPVTIEVFFAPNPTAYARLDDLKALQAAHPARIRLVYRVLAQSAQAMLPAALLEAHGEGKFFEMLSALQTMPPTPRRYQIDNAALTDLAIRIGLDPARFAAALGHHWHELDDNQTRFRRLVDRPLPEVLFNGEVLPGQFATVGAGALEAAFRTADERAKDLVDRGAAPADVVDAEQDQRRLRLVEPDPSTHVASELPRLNGNGDVPMSEYDRQYYAAEAARDAFGHRDQRLASPPLDVRDLPSFGKPEAPVTIVALCSPLSSRCASGMLVAAEVQRLFPTDVRVLWSPWFDLAAANATELGLLSDAALCAERVGTAAADHGDDPSSSGWRWTLAMYDATRRIARLPGKLSPERRIGLATDAIDAVAAALHVDRRAFAECRARTAGRSQDLVAAARKSGVHGSPATVIDGRIQDHGIGDGDGPILKTLVEAELAPGVLGELAPTWAHAASR